METPEPTRQDSPFSARRQVEILNALGFHMRPAQRVAELVSKFDADVRLKFEAKECAATAILEMLFLAVPQGSPIELMARGPDAERVLDALVELVAAHFYEDDNGQDLPTKPEEPEPPSSS